ncbi:MAG: phosphatase PAP2 family protein [Acidobacteriota bacterium]
MMGAESQQTKAPIEEAVDELRAAAEAATVAPLVARRRARRLQYLLIFSLSIFILLAIAVSVDGDRYFDWDVALSRAIQSIPGIEPLMRIISIPGNNSLIAFGLVTITFFFLFMLRYRLEAYALVLSAGGGEFFNIAFKWLIGRPRPNMQLVNILVHETSRSFPSGHVMHYVNFYGMLFFFAYTLLRRSALRSLLIVTWGGLVLLVGLSRIYLGAHWPSDVAAAYLGGGVWSIFVIDRYRHWIKQNNNVKEIDH